MAVSVLEAVGHFSRIQTDTAGTAENIHQTVTKGTMRSEVKTEAASVKMIHLERSI